MNATRWISVAQAIVTPIQIGSAVGSVALLVPPKPKTGLGGVVPPKKLPLLPDAVVKTAPEGGDEVELTTPAGPTGIASILFVVPRLALFTGNSCSS